MSQAIELYKQLDGEFKASGVFYCSECRTVFPNEAQAQTCHGERMCACGRKIDRRFYAECSDCQQKRWTEEQRVKELERFNKATKITYAEYGDGMLYDGDRYFADLEEMEDHYFDADLPEYVWACKDVGVPKATSEGIVEHLTENMWEDADHTDLNGLDALDAAIAEFNKANESIHVWEPDYKTAIILQTHEKFTNSAEVEGK